MILCCGESLIDMLPSLASDGVTSFTPHAGGSVFNTAIALGRLQVPTGLLSGISSDLFGDLLRERLTESQVDISFAIRSDRPTTLAFVQLIGGQARYTFYDENSAGRLLKSEDLPEIPYRVRALFFGGISLVSEPCANFYASLAIRESASRVIITDPNIRAEMIVDEERYRARLDQVIARTDVLKVSMEDLDWLIAGPVATTEKAGQLQKKGPSLIIVTKGGEGAMALLPGGRLIEVDALPVRVVDTIGAGDTFNAGFLAYLFRNEFLRREALEGLSETHTREALRLGVSAAAVTVSRTGADPPWVGELLQSS